MTCHPRLGGASHREAGVTGIPVGLFLFILALDSLADEKKNSGTVGFQTEDVNFAS